MFPVLGFLYFYNMTCILSSLVIFIFFDISGCVTLLKLRQHHQKFFIVYLPGVWHFAEVEFITIYSVILHTLYF